MADRLEINVAAQLAKSLLAEVAALEQEGDTLSLRRAQAIRVQAERLILEQGIEDPEVEAECFVPLTPAEVSQQTAAGEQAATDTAAAAVIAETEKTLRDRAEAALPKLVNGANAIKNGTLFVALTVNERAYLELLGRTDAALIRILLRKLDATD